jgi:hypothetical protein
VATVDETLQYFEELEETFSTKGWKNLIQEAKAQLYQYQNDAIEVDSWEKVCEIRGEVRQLSRLLNLEEMISILKDQATRQAAEDAENAGL